MTFTGTFDPGLSPTLTSAGSITFGPTNTLLMELGGTSRGNEYDAIVASGTLVLDGTLAVTLISGFNPAACNSFNLFDWAGLAGTFGTLQLPALSGSLVWDTTQLYTTGVLGVAAPGVSGDYNNYGSVDAADYVLWRKNNNTTITLPNDSTPGTDQSDYTVWRANFGRTAGSGSGVGANATVPEPTTLVLLMFSHACWCLRRAAPHRKSQQLSNA